MSASPPPSPVFSDRLLLRVARALGDGVAACALAGARPVAPALRDAVELEAMRSFCCPTWCPSSASFLISAFLKRRLAPLLCRAQRAFLSRSKRRGGEDVDPEWRMVLEDPLAVQTWTSPIIATCALSHNGAPMGLVLRAELLEVSVREWIGDVGTTFSVADVPEFVAAFQAARRGGSRLRARAVLEAFFTSHKLPASRGGNPFPDPEVNFAAIGELTRWGAAPELRAVAEKLGCERSLADLVPELRCEHRRPSDQDREGEWWGVQHALWKCELSTASPASITALTGEEDRKRFRRHKACRTDSDLRALSSSLVAFVFQRLLQARRHQEKVSDRYRDLALVRTARHFMPVGDSVRGALCDFVHVLPVSLVRRGTRAAAALSAPFRMMKQDKVGDAGERGNVEEHEAVIVAARCLLVALREGDLVRARLFADLAEEVARLSRCAFLGNLIGVMAVGTVAQCAPVLRRRDCVSFSNQIARRWAELSGTTSEFGALPIEKAHGSHELSSREHEALTHAMRSSSFGRVSLLATVQALCSEHNNLSEGAAPKDIARVPLSREGIGEDGVERLPELSTPLLRELRLHLELRLRNRFAGPQARRLLRVLEGGSFSLFVAARTLHDIEHGIFGYALGVLWPGRDEAPLEIGALAERVWAFRFKVLLDHATHMIHKRCSPRSRKVGSRADLFVCGPCHVVTAGLSAFTVCQRLAEDLSVFIASAKCSQPEFERALRCVVAENSEAHGFHVEPILREAAWRAVRLAGLDERQFAGFLTKRPAWAGTCP